MVAPITMASLTLRSGCLTSAAAKALLCHESAENSDQRVDPARMPRATEICVQRGGVSSKKNPQHKQTAQRPVLAMVNTF